MGQQSGYFGPNSSDEVDLRIQEPQGALQGRERTESGGDVSRHSDTVFAKHSEHSRERCHGNIGLDTEQGDLSAHLVT